MQAVAAAVVGEHDFSAFCRSVEGKSNVRVVDEARWESGDDLLTFWIQANAFCHQMVRSLVGFAYDIGRGFTGIDSISEIIDGRRPEPGRDCRPTPRPDAVGGRLLRWTGPGWFDRQIRPG